MRCDSALRPGTPNIAAVVAQASLPALAPVTALLTLLQLGVGAALLAWALDVVGHVGRGYRGTTALICAVIVAIALLIDASLPNPATLLSGGSASAFATSIHLTVALLGLLLVDALFAAVGTDGARYTIGALTALVGLGALLAAGVAFTPLPGASLVALLSLGAGTLLCGTSLAGMLLGHWYLLAPDLTFRPLRMAVYAVFGAVAAAAVVAVIGLASASADARASVIGGGYALPFWLLVIGSGVGFTAAVDALTLHFARIRANQPATAMLYGLIISALMGAVPATLILLRTGVGV